MAKFASWKALARRKTRWALTGGTLSPRDMAALYGLDALHSQGIYGQGETIGFIEFARPAQQDDTIFWDAQSLAPQLNRPAETVDVDRAPSDPTALDETDLDLQYAGALAPGAELRVYLISSQSSVADFLGQMYDGLYRAAADGVRIVSISLGTGENLFAGANGIRAPLAGRSWQDAAAYAADLDALIRQHGMAVFAAAGDAGAYGGLPFGDKQAQPIWPAIQPAVIAVGGTQLVVPGDPASGEWAWGGQTMNPSGPGYAAGNTLPTASGGGGVSRYLAAPPYQASLGLRGRCTPDIAAFAGPLVIVDRGQQSSIWGTSAASPIAAAVAALQHQASGRLLDHAGLYGAARDVQAGNNWNDQLMVLGLNDFAQAAAGYDQCTGVGTVAV